MAKKKKTKSQMGKMRKNKGANGEREFAKLLTESGYPSHRGRQYHGGSDSPDVRTSVDDLFNFEVKRVETLNVNKAYDQICADSDGMDVLPVVAHRKNGTPWLITMGFEGWIKLVKEYVNKEGGDLL